MTSSERLTQYFDLVNKVISVELADVFAFDSVPNARDPESDENRSFPGCLCARE